MKTGQGVLPAVGATLERPAIQALMREWPRSLVVDAVRAVLAAGRAGAEMPTTDAAWQRAVIAELRRRTATSLRAALNATGVVLHTNLGRAPLARTALDAIAAIGPGAATVEYDVDAGTRGSRHVHCAQLLAELSGAEDALVVNNCAAALVLTLQALAAGRETLVSRGELIEIGGSFRVPDIMAASGTVLREVGTTNRTHLDDYRRAVTRETGAIVKVHRSNFTVSGFVAEASLAELVPVAAEGQVPLIFDFGSGLLVDLSPWGLRGEPTARDAVRTGATAVLMSGDKLLGGPQAGIIVGRRAAVAALRRHPLARALRVDKLTLAALEATLALYRDPARAVREVPALAMLTASVEALRTRAAALRAGLGALDARVEVVDSESTVGGGAFPAARIPSVALRLAGAAEALDARLRRGTVPVIGTIRDGRLRLDLRSVPETQDEVLAHRLREVLA